MKAVEWAVIERMPCSIELLKIPKSLAAFYDYDEYERLVAAAREIDHRTYLAVLLGAEADGGRIRSIGRSTETPHSGIGSR